MTWTVSASFPLLGFWPNPELERQSRLLEETLQLNGIQRSGHVPAQSNDTLNKHKDSSLRTGNEWMKDARGKDGAVETLVIGGTILVQC